jgi:hypothetical protein
MSPQVLSQRNLRFQYAHGVQQTICWFRRKVCDACGRFRKCICGAGSSAREPAETLAPEGLKGMQPYLQNVDGQNPFSP